MHLPPRKHLAWPLRAGLSAGLASLMSLARSTIFVDAASANVLAAVFGTVVAIAAARPAAPRRRRGAPAAPSWLHLSALCAALFGSSWAVLFSNSSSASWCSTPTIPVLAQVAFGGHALGRLRKPRPPLVRLGIPICAAYGAACASSTSFPTAPPTSPERLRRRRFARRRVDDAVAAYASVDPSERKMRRARAATFRRDAERHLAAPRPRRGRAMGAPGDRVRGSDPQSSNRRATTEDDRTRGGGAGAVRGAARAHVPGAGRAGGHGRRAMHLLDPPSPARTPRGFEGARASTTCWSPSATPCRGDAPLGTEGGGVVGAEARAARGGVPPTTRFSRRNVGGTTRRTRNTQTPPRRWRDARYRRTISSCFRFRASRGRW